MFYHWGSRRKRSVSSVYPSDWPSSHRSDKFPTRLNILAAVWLRRSVKWKKYFCLWALRSVSRLLSRQIGDGERKRERELERERQCPGISEVFPACCLRESSSPLLTWHDDGSLKLIQPGALLFLFFLKEKKKSHLLAGNTIRSSVWRMFAFFWLSLFFSLPAFTENDSLSDNKSVFVLSRSI